MMLVASLFISGSYDRIAGYAPGSQVTDHNAVDLDQAVMESHLKAATDDGFAKALNVYSNGGNSKSYALLTVPALAKDIKADALPPTTGHSMMAGQWRGRSSPGDNSPHRPREDA